MLLHAGTLHLAEDKYRQSQAHALGSLGQQALTYPINNDGNSRPTMINCLRSASSLSFSCMCSSHKSKKQQAQLEPLLCDHSLPAIKRITAHACMEATGSNACDAIGCQNVPSCFGPWKSVQT